MPPAEYSLEFDPKLFHPQLGYGMIVSDEVDSEVEEEIIGKSDTRKPVKDTIKVPYRWICQILATFQAPSLAGGDPTVKIGTGVLVGPRHVLTAAHNVRERFNGTVLTARQVEISPGQNRGLLPFGRYKIKGFKAPKEWDGSAHCYDYAVIELEEDVGTNKFKSLRDKPLGFWGSTGAGEDTKIELLDPAKLRKKTIHLSGYAGDKCGYMTIVPHTPGARCYAGQATPGPAELKQCMNNKLLGSAQYGTKGKVIDPGRGGLEQLLLYDADTCGAQSGSPVWMQSGRYRYLVGVHTGTFDLSSGTCANTQPGNIVDANRATRLTDQVLKNIRSWM